MSTAGAQVTRRGFVGLTIAGLGGLALGRPSFGRGLPRARSMFSATSTFFTWKELREGIHATTESGTGGNAVVIQTEAGAVLIDAKNAQFGTTLRREAGALGEPVNLLINTHHHADHTGGNHAFLDPTFLDPDAAGEGAERAPRVLMHPNAKPRVEAQLGRYQDTLRSAARSIEDEMEAQARAEILALVEKADELEASSFAPSAVLPDGFFSGQTMPVGERRLMLRHVGPGHTDNDVFIFIEDANVLHTGDLVFHRLHPFFDESAKATSRGWIDSCAQMIELCDEKTVVVPGHGEITDVEGIKEQIAYFEAVRDAAGEAIDAGKTKEEFAESEIKSIGVYGNQRLKARTFGSVYEEVLAEREGG